MAWIGGYRIRLDDVDAAGVVFYARIFAIAHNAYEDALTVAGLPLSVLLKDGKHGLPLVHAEADFVKPLRHGQEVTISVAATAIGERSYTVTIGLTTESGSCSTVKQVHSCIDRTTGGACSIPAEIRAALNRLIIPST